MLNKIISLLCSSILSASCLLFAQTPTDYSLTLDRNPWLTSTNGAALTTFRDSNVTKAGLYYSPLTIDVASVFRLSPKTVVSGRIAYSYDTDNNHTGSVFYSKEQDFLNLSPRSGGVGGGLPFDIIIPTPGIIKTEEISLAGAIGWQAAKSLSLGTLFNYNKQTAWLYPQSSTEKETAWTPYATLQRSFPIKNKFLLIPQLAVTTKTLHAGLSASF